MSDFDQDEFEREIGHFTGSETFYRHMMGVVLTEGAKFAADKLGCYWLLDKIATIPISGREDFQVWKFTRHVEKGGKITCEDGNGKVIYSEEIEFTDFPIQQFTFWKEGNTILLPSEH